jgi:hypothetical protein
MPRAACILVAAIVLPALLAAADPSDGTSAWSRSLRLGILVTNTAAANSATSRDATIAGTNRSTSWLGSLDAGLMWKGAGDEVQQDLKARYGRIKQTGAIWTENTDELRYDGVVRHAIGAPNIIYQSWGAASVFNGPGQETRFADPTLIWLAGGYGRKHADVLVIDGSGHKDIAEGRLGARVQRRFGTVEKRDRGPSAGIDAFGRYERTADKAFTGFVQYEGYAPFTDLRNATNLVTAGLGLSLAGVVAGADLRVELAYRAYCQTRPRHIEDGEAAGYGGWSMRQDTLLGLAWSI